MCDFCDASANFQAPHKMLSPPRLLTLCHVFAALTLRFIKTATAPRHKMLRLPPQNDTVTLTGFQSIAPATQNANATPTHVTKRHKTMLLARKSTSNKWFCQNFVSAAQRQRINAIPRTQTSDDGRKTHDRRTRSNPQTPTYKREPFATHSGKTVWCSTPNQLLICSSFHKENGLLLCSFCSSRYATTNQGTHTWIVAVPARLVPRFQTLWRRCRHHGKYPSSEKHLGSFVVFVPQT